MNVYPLLFKPNLHEVVWGGHRLKPFKSMAADDVRIGESWEVSAVPSSPSIVSNGSEAGKPLTQVVEEWGPDLLGNRVFEKYGGVLPLLVKFIDAEGDLSIQVHPGDELARQRHGKMGKSEMWYVLDAKPGAYLYAGFSKSIDSEEYQRRVADGTITEVLARHEVHPGDVFYLPAGRVHAICSGILLAEVQQSSDVTYRIFDYNRPGLDGKPRELHTQLAAEALDYEVIDDYRTNYSTAINKSNLVLDTPYFSVRVSDVESRFHRDLIKYDSFIVCMCLSGDCRIHVRSTHEYVTLLEGYCCLIPASIADYDIIPLGNRTRVLDAFINNKDTSLPRRITRFFHITKK